MEAEDPKEKMDLFKAIFASSDEESDTEDTSKNKTSQDDQTSTARMDRVEKSTSSSKNVLRNTSPPRGIFANLDLDALKPKPLPPKEKGNDISKDVSSTKVENEELDPGLLYGPSLPSKPVFIPKIINLMESGTSSSSEDEWIEKEKHKKKKHSKKHKKEKKKEKYKHKKKKKR